MQTSREYGFNGIFKENYLKADPLFIFCPPPQWPPLRRKAIPCQGQIKGPQHKFTTCSLLLRADDADTQARTAASFCQASWIMFVWWWDVFHSTGMHRYCRNISSLPSCVLLQFSSAFPTHTKGQLLFPCRSDPEIVVTHVCFLCCLTWEKRGGKRNKFTLRAAKTNVKSEASSCGK